METSMGNVTTTVFAEGLVKRFGSTTALDGFDLSVGRGSVVGLLGPNGAGKTTAVRILTTLLRPDAGRAEVAGFDVMREADRVRQRIGLVGQSPAVDEVLSGRQNLVMFGRLFHLGARRAGQRADELLETFRLADTGRKPVKQYSGGMRRRIDLAASLILAPEVLFLDEPTTGLDPRGRSEVWSAIRQLVADGTTVVLTTQYLDEADQLADRICVIDRGKVIAEGSPDDLKSELGGDRVTVVVRRVEDLPAATAIVGDAAATAPEVDDDLRRISAPVANRVQAMSAIFTGLAAAEIEAEDLAVRRPTLDEVFMDLTGHPAEQATDQPDQHPDQEEAA